MSRKFYLKDKEGYIKSEINIKEADKHSISGECIDYCSWSCDEKIPGEYHYFASFIIKWDSCSHWNFYGEDYPEDKDSYYHICGGSCGEEFLQSFSFIWKVAQMLLDNNYFEMPNYIDYILKDFTIEESK